MLKSTFNKSLIPPFHFLYTLSMPFAPKIRKDILHVLDTHILPALKNRKIPQTLAEPPFDFGDVAQQIIQKKFLADKTYAPLQSEQRWQREGVASSNMPVIMFAYDGICYERIGITRKQAMQVGTRARRSLGGIHVLKLPAPALLCHPAFMLRSLGKPRPESLAHPGRSLIYQLTKTGIWVSLNVRGPQEESVTHNLEINDPVLSQMGNIYIEELRASDNHEGAQAQQLALMLRLKRYLLHHHPSISNSCWIIPPDPARDTSETLSSKNLNLCRDLMEYIITHLHAPLSLENLAAHFGVSTVHLNSIFKQAQGVTIMRYVTQLRIEAAKTIIREQPERINDVAELVGFSSAASFCIVFRKHTGCSPNQFRQSAAAEPNKNKSI